MHPRSNVNYVMSYFPNAHFCLTPANYGSARYELNATQRSEYSTRCLSVVFVYKAPVSEFLHFYGRLQVLDCVRNILDMISTNIIANQLVVERLYVQPKTQLTATKINRTKICFFFSPPVTSINCSSNRRTPLMLYISQYQCKKIFWPGTKLFLWSC